MAGLIDVQSGSDNRGIPIGEAGICGVRFPISVRDLARGTQATVAEIRMSASVPASIKGTHMSRFLDVLMERQDELTLETIPVILRQVQSRLGAEEASISARFPYFLWKQAPVSGRVFPVEHFVTFSGRARGEFSEAELTVEVPVTTLCPCSKEISDYGAHNQRGIVSISVNCREFVWAERLIGVAEGAASAPVYGILKRPDERHVTMLAYDNPVFVEDVVRGVISVLSKDSAISKGTVRATNDESIHGHAAFARAEWVFCG